MTVDVLIFPIKEGLAGDFESAAEAGVDCWSGRGLGEARAVYWDSALTTNEPDPI